MAFGTLLDKRQVEMFTFDEMGPNTTLRFMLSPYLSRDITFKTPVEPTPYTYEPGSVLPNFRFKAPSPYLVEAGSFTVRKPSRSFSPHT